MPATGPISAEGKAVSSRNAVRHGLYSEVVVVTADEAAADWLAFHDAATDALSPEGALEHALASRVAALAWRLRRVPAAEAEIIDRAAAHAADAYARSDRIAARLEDGAEATKTFYGGIAIVQPPRSLPDEARFAGLLRLEAHLNRQLLHTLHELEALQERRRGNRAPLARVDVHGLPGL